VRTQFGAIAGGNVATVTPTSRQQSTTESRRLFSLFAATFKPVSRTV